MDEAQKQKQEQKDLKDSRRSYVWALSFAKPYKGKIALLAICGLMGVAGETLTPRMIQYVIDHVVPEGDFKLFYIILAVLVGVNVLMLVAKNFRNILQRTIGELASRDMQTAIFKHLRRLGFAHYEQHPAGETLSMFNSEVMNVQKMYRNFLPGVIENTMFVIVSVGLLISISGWLTLIIVPAFAMYYMFGPYFERKAALNGRKSGQTRIAYNQVVYEAISGLREFRAFGSQPWYHERTLAKHKNWAHYYLLSSTYGFSRGSFRRFTFYLGAVALFLLTIIACKTI